MTLAETLLLAESAMNRAHALLGMLEDYPHVATSATRIELSRAMTAVHDARAALALDCHLCGAAPNEPHATGCKRAA